MFSIQQNDLVTLTFTGKLDNGEIFKSVTEEHPLIVRIGNLEIPPTLEEALLGMAIGETRTVRLSPDESYGPRRPDLVQTITNQEMIKKIKPKPGMILSLKLVRDGEEHFVPATVLKVNDTEIEVDYNHPLAGHHTTYMITVVNIERQDTTTDAPDI